MDYLGIRLPPPFLSGGNPRLRMLLFKEIGNAYKQSIPKTFCHIGHLPDFLYYIIIFLSDPRRTLVKYIRQVQQF